MFRIEKRIANRLGRAGILTTPHGDIHTPAFVVVGTKGTVKSLTPEQVRDFVGADVVLANTYHLYLEPGDEIVRDAGGLGKFMNWPGPTMTDSGGFQVFSLGAAYGKGITKFVTASFEESLAVYDESIASQHGQLAIVDDEGVSFTSHLDGSLHRFTPERSIEIQHNLGADIMFAFDECTSPTAPYEYQREAMERTHRWAERSLRTHRQLEYEKLKTGLPAEALEKRRQALFGIVQGGRFKDLRKESAKVISSMHFDGFGIGGSFSKEDLDEALIWVNEILPGEKPRHLLGIGEPGDLFLGVEHGIDLFDCVAPTREARNGSLYTHQGKINILNEKFKNDFKAVDEKCNCYTCGSYTKAYLAHLFRAQEMLGATLASIHNLYFIVNLVKNIRKSIVGENFAECKAVFLASYYNYATG